MIVGLSGVRADIIPFALAQGALANLIGLNVIGMRRRGIAKFDIHRYREVYQELFFGDGEFRQRFERIAKAYESDPLVAKLIDFVRVGKRPLTMAVIRADLDENA